MERRRFLKGLAALVGGVALEQAIPLGRVWSFPKEIRLVRDPHLLRLTNCSYLQKGDIITFESISGVSMLEPFIVTSVKGNGVFEIFPAPPARFKSVQPVGYFPSALPEDALFHPEPEIVEAYRRGEIGRVGYYSLDES